MKQRGRGAMDIVHRHNPIFIPVTVTEMSRLGALPDVFWPRALSSFT
jgi:hypothetical protein